MKRIRFTLVELLVVIAIIAILASLLLAAVNMAMIRAKKVAAKADALNLKSAIVMFQSDNQRLPIVGDPGLDGAFGTADDVLADASANTVLTLPQYKNLIDVLRGQSIIDNKRKRQYLPLARPFEGTQQYKCKLTDGYKTAEAPFYVVLNVDEAGINFDGITIQEAAVVYWSEAPSPVNLTNIKETGVCTADLP